MAIMAQAMGGPRAGTAMLSLYNQVATGKMTKPAALGMQDLGLLGADEWRATTARNHRPQGRRRGWQTSTKTRWILSTKFIRTLKPA